MVISQELGKHQSSPSEITPLVLKGRSLISLLYSYQHNGLSTGFLAPSLFPAHHIPMLRFSIFFSIAQEYLSCSNTFSGSLLPLFKNYLFIYLWLCWVFISVQGLSPVAASGGHSSSWCAGLLLSWPLLLRSTVSRRAGSVVVAHGPSCSAACGILPDQGPNPCPLHWQADSQPLRRQGSPPITS